MIREWTLNAREKLVGKLPISGELLRGTLLERTVRHTKNCPKCARGEGHRVFVLTRRPRREGDISWSPGGGDRAWMAAIDGADAVVNLAGEGIADTRWTAARKSAILASRIDATRSIVAAIRAARTPPGVLISSSAIGAVSLFEVFEGSPGTRRDPRPS